MMEQQPPIDVQYREDFAIQHCDIPGCNCDSDLLYVETICHPGADLDAVVSKALGVLVLSCAVCEEPVIAIAIARNGPARG